VVWRQIEDALAHHVRARDDIRQPPNHLAYAATTGQRCYVRNTVYWTDRNESYVSLGGDQLSVERPGSRSHSPRRGG
jgi:hypothetical protein